MQGPTSNPQCCKNTPKAKYKHKTVKLKNSKKKKKKRKKERKCQAGRRIRSAQLAWII
jgi:hypothetical protein